MQNDSGEESPPVNYRDMILERADDINLDFDSFMFVVSELGTQKDVGEPDATSN